MLEAGVEVELSLSSEVQPEFREYERPARKADGAPCEAPTVLLAPEFGALVLQPKVKSEYLNRSAFLQGDLNQL